MLLSQKKIQASDNYGYESKPSLIFSDIFQDYSYCWKILLNSFKIRIYQKKMNPGPASQKSPDPDSWS